MDLMEIHDQYYERVNRFIVSLVKDQWAADDLIQETFIKVRNSLDSVRDPEKLSSWIYRIAYNLCQDHFKTIKKEAINGCELEVKSEPLIPESIKNTIQTKLEQQQMGSCVQQQVDSLPEALKTILTMYDVLGFTHKEIAEIIDITEKNSKVRLHRARQALKKILEEKCTFEIDHRNVLVCEPVNPISHEKN
jgi:RNA polymerase sigma-70 factor (ECF subfamily)